MTPEGPLISVVALAPYGLDELKDTLRALQEQTIVSQLEVIIGLREEDRSGRPEGVEMFNSFRTFVDSPMDVSGPAKARAAHMATSPIVAFVEDHCFPEPAWAEALVKAHRGPWGAVAPTVGPANPTSVIAQASFANSFGAWSSERRGECSNLPTHNTSYKKRVLLDYGEELPELLEMEAAALAPDLIHRGFRIYQEPSAKVHHMNVETVSAFLMEQFLGGRHYGALRCKSWSSSRKLVYSLGGWLIPFVKLFRMLSQAEQFKSRRMLGIVILGLFTCAAGEVAGYLLGLGKTEEERFELEYRRWRFTKKVYHYRDVIDVE